jgi:TfoX/Sxy family transcriptional regulator of competence genes
MSMPRERALELADRLHAMDPVTVTRFFGGAALRKDGVLFAFVIEGTLYMRVDDAGRARFAALGASPFVYAGRKQSVKVSGYYEGFRDMIRIHVPSRRRVWRDGFLHPGTSMPPDSLHTALVEFLPAASVATYLRCSRSSNVRRAGTR